MGNQNQSAGTGNETLESLGYKQELNRVLGLPQVVIFGLAYVAPMTVFTTYGIVTVQSHGMLPLAYIVATIVMTFTALSYRQMVKAYPMAGSVYTYVSRSIHPHVGFLSGWAILLDYILLPLIVYIVCPLYLVAVVPGIPAWLWTILFIVVTTVINLIGVKVTAWADNIVVIVQVIFVVAVAIVSINFIVHGGGSGTLINSKAIFNPTEYANIGGFSTIFACASVLALSFLGFDAVTTLTEETKNPVKTVGKGIIIIAIAAGVYFIVYTYIMMNGWPDAWKDMKTPDAGAMEYFAYACGQVFAVAFSLISIVSGTGNAVVGQAAAARIIYGMGRDGVLPKKFFGYVNPKTKVPTFNILLLGAIGFIAFGMDLTLACTLINFGALLGFVLVNVSVIAHYWGRQKERGGKAVFTYLILPLCGAITCAVIWWNLDIHSKIVGSIWLVIGFIYLLVSTNFFRKKPPTLQDM